MPKPATFKPGKAKRFRKQYGDWVEEYEIDVHVCSCGWKSGGIYDNDTPLALVQHRLDHLEGFENARV